MSGAVASHATPNERERELTDGPSSKIHSFSSGRSAPLVLQFRWCAFGQASRIGADIGCLSSGSGRTGDRMDRCDRHPRRCRQTETHLEKGPGRRRGGRGVADGADRSCHRPGPDLLLSINISGVVIINQDEQQFEVFRGSAPGSLFQPVGVAVADDGTLYVSDASSQAVYAYDAALQFKMVYGGASVFDRPTSIAVTAGGDRIAVCDARTPRGRCDRHRDRRNRHDLGWQ